MGERGIRVMPLALLLIVVAVAAHARPDTVRVFAANSHDRSATCDNDEQEPLTPASLLATVAGGLRAGLPQQQAWLVALSHNGVTAGAASPTGFELLCERGARGLRSGATITSVLSEMAAIYPPSDSPAGGDPNADGQALGFLTCAVEVSHELGIPMNRILARVEQILDDQAEAELASDSALAGPAQSMRLLTWLPCVGLVIGELMGAQPLSFLISSPVGFCVALTAAGLILAGRRWSSRLVASAKSPHRTTSTRRRPAW